MLRGMVVNEQGPPEKAAGAVDVLLDSARHQPGHPDSGQPIALRQHNQHGRHCAGGAADLEGRATQPGDHHAGQNSCHQASRRIGPAGYAKSQRQRQRHRPDRQPGQQITLEDRPVIFCKLAPPGRK